MASVLVASGLDQEARAAIAAARASVPDLPDTYEIEGWLEEQAGRPDRATSAYARAVAGDAGRSFAEYRLAALSWPGEDTPPPERRNALEAVAERLRHATTMRPGVASPLALLALALIELGRTDEATTHARVAVTLEPWAAGHRLVAARVLASAGQTEQARSEAQAALRLHATPEERRRAEEILDALAGTHLRSPQGPGGR